MLDYNSEEGKDSAESAYTYMSIQKDMDTTTPAGSQHFFEVKHEDGIFLTSRMLFEALSNHSIIAPQKWTLPLESPYPKPAHKRQQVDIESIVF